MPLQDYDKTRQYTKYKRHVDNSNEKVNASTVNKIQSDINEQQHETNLVKDTAFEERVYTIFNNNLYTNAMFVDYYKQGQYLNLNESDNVEINFEKTQLSLKAGSKSGTAISSKIYSVHGSDVEMNDFFLITNQDVPVGAEIKYYLGTNKGERWPILANALKLPLHLTENIKNGFKVVAELKSNSLGESPLLNGYAVLYWDAKVEENYGMTNPDLMRFP